MFAHIWHDTSCGWYLVAGSELNCNWHIITLSLMEESLCDIWSLCSWCNLSFSQVTRYYILYSIIWDEEIIPKHSIYTICLFFFPVCFNPCVFIILGLFQILTFFLSRLVSVNILVLNFLNQVRGRKHTINPYTPFVVVL